MALDRQSGVNLWRQIVEALRNEIHSGILVPGTQLPTEALLSKRFGVNRHTVRRALNALEEDGIVRAEQGRGTFVHESIIDYEIGKRTRFSETMERLERAPERTLLHAERRKSTVDEAKALGLRAGAAIEVIELVGRADSRPISLASHHFPASRFGGIAEAFKERGSITSALRHFGIDDYVRSATRVTARPADPLEQQLLELTRRRPLLVAESTNTEPDGNTIEYGVTRFAADRVQLLFRP